MKGTTMLRYAVLVLMGLVMTGGAAQAQTATFNDQQKKEIGEIIHQYLLDNPGVLFEAAEKHQQDQERKADEGAVKALSELGDKLFANPELPALGNPKAQTTFVEFFDYNCGYCKQAFPGLVKLVEENKNIRVVLVDTPILSPQSYEAARWAIAAKQHGKYNEFHQALMTYQGPKDETALADLATKVGLDAKKIKEEAAGPAVAKRLDENMKIFHDLGLNGTPGFAARDRVIRGFAGPDVLKQIASDLESGKGTPAAKP